MTISITVPAAAHLPSSSGQPFPLLSSTENSSANLRDIAADAAHPTPLSAYTPQDGPDNPFAAFMPDRRTPNEAVETDAAHANFRATHRVKHYQGDTDTGTLAGPLYAVEEQALADLRVGQGKYATLPVIRDILQRWQMEGPSPQVRAAYGNWKSSGSLELLLDALVAEMQGDGTWFRLARNDIATDSIREWVSDALTGAPYERNEQMDRQACNALSDWSSLAPVESRAIEKKLRFIKVMEAAFREMDAERYAASSSEQSRGTLTEPDACP